MNSLISISRRGSRVVAAFAFASIAGCMSNPHYDGADYGRSVRGMELSQTLDPEASKVPPQDSMQPVDGIKGEVILNTYRQDVAKPGEVRNEIIVNIGN